MIWRWIIWKIIPLPVPNWASAEAQFIPNFSLHTKFFIGGPFEAKFSTKNCLQIQTVFVFASVCLGLRSGAAKVRQSRYVRPPESSSSSSTQYRVEIVLWNWFCKLYLIANTLWAKYKIQIQNTDCKKMSKIYRPKKKWFFDFSRFSRKKWCLRRTAVTFERKIWH